MSDYKMLSARQVREMLGGISNMTLWRWLNSGEHGFPRPKYIGQRRYWREADIINWLEK
ncbi:helix-turn-helix transcriptional regulator [Rhodosalinus sediminis]|uniref:helix-turn-helix transcriptional regulator n=1 Tax=Rhodosalinus sediminis TaxID=1940533 RepID=UPI0023528973|nr:helix-turn-helix domain-containing protein [Rhodosalinus sediminis]